MTPTRHLASAFAKLLYEIYKAVAPAQLLFQNINNQNALKVAIIEYFLSDNQRKIEEEFTQEAIAEKSKTLPLRTFTDHVRQQFQTFIDEFTFERTTMIEQRYKKKKPPQSRGGFSYQKNSMLRSNGRYIRFTLLYFNLPFSKPIFRRTRFFPFASRIAFSSLADHFRHRQKIVGF